MTNLNQAPRPPEPVSTEPIELELKALEIVAHPAVLQMEIMILGGLAVAKAIDLAINESEV